MLEYEKKIMLTAKEYFAILLLMYKHAPVNIQTNYYFDNDDLSMNEKGITYRIRAKDGKYKATMKSHISQYPDCSIESNLNEKSEFDPQIFNVFGLHYQGNLVTERAVLYQDSFCKMVLDRNIYLGHTDFELEVEYDRESEKKAKVLLEDVAEFLSVKEKLTKVNDFLSRVGKGKSKSGRFFERLKKLK